MRFILIITLFCIAIIEMNGQTGLTNQTDKDWQKIMSLYDNDNEGSALSSESEGILDISPRTLNATYSYIISNESKNGIPLNFTLDYNGGIQHKALLGVKMGSDNYQTFSKKMPVWFLSINGFVVQALTENRTIFADPGLYKHNRYTDTELDSNKYPFTNKDFNFSIEGYHYNNRLVTYEDINYYETVKKNHDKINILKSDGSLLTLVNTEDIDNNYREGVYIEKGVNSKGYALVEEINENLTCDVNRVQIGHNTFTELKRRKVRYFPGNGLEYEFIEYLSPYGTDLLENENNLISDFIVWKPGTVGFFSAANYFNQSMFNNLMHMMTNTTPNIKPTVFYLTKIITDNQVIADFYYDRHNTELSECTDNSFGRAKLMQFNNNWINYNDGNIVVNTSGKNITINLEYRNETGEIENITPFGGDIKHWINNNNEYEKFIPHDFSGYIFDAKKLEGISKRLFEGLEERSNYYRTSLFSEHPRSYNHYYYIRYVKDIQILDQQINDDITVGNEKLEKKISFEYESYNKKLSSLIFHHPSNQNNDHDFHPILKFIGLPMASNNYPNDVLDDEFRSNGDNLQHIVESDIEIQNLRLSKIIKPSEIVELDYHNTDGNSNSVNELNYFDDYKNTQKDKRNYYFSNNAVKEIRFYNNPSSSPTTSTSTLHKRMSYDLLMEIPNGEDSYYRCSTYGAPSVVYDFLTSNENVELFNPVSSNKISEVETDTYYRTYYPFDARLREENIYKAGNYSVVLPFKSIKTFKDLLNSSNNRIITNRTGYKAICDNSGSMVNLIKPFFTRSWLKEGNGNQFCTSLEFYEYELTDINLDLRELTAVGSNINQKFGREISKKIKYICDPISNVTDYETFLNNISNNYIVRIENDYHHLEKLESSHPHINRQLKENYPAFLQKYYTDANVTTTTDFNVSVPSLESKLYSSINNTLINSATDEYDFFDILGYLVSDTRSNLNVYSDTYSYSYLCAKPQFGLLKSEKIYNSNNDLLSGSIFEYEDDYIDNGVLTYSRGKIISEKILESELYGGNSNNYISPSTIEYSKGSQSGGYPSRITNTNGAIIDNYYVYNQNLHLNTNGTNPVKTVQDYWDPSLYDSDSFPLSNLEYFTPGGKLITFDKNQRIERLKESYNVFYRDKPVGVRNYVRKFKPINGNIEFFDNIPNENAMNVTSSSSSSHPSGSFYTPVNNEVLSLNTAFEYDNYGNLTGVIDNNGYLSKYKFDNFSRLLKSNLPYDFNTEPAVENLAVNKYVISGIGMTEQVKVNALYTNYEDQGVDTFYLDQNKTINYNIGNVLSQYFATLDDTLNSGLYFDKLSVGQDLYPDHFRYHFEDEFNGQELFSISLGVRKARITFRPQKDLTSIEDITDARIELFLQSVPLLLPNGIPLYISIPELTLSNGDPFEKMITITQSNVQNQNGFERITIDLSDYIDLNDLKILLNSTDGSIKSKKLTLEISTKSGISNFYYTNYIGVGNSNYMNGDISFYHNSENNILNPKLIIEGEITKANLFDIDDFTSVEFTNSMNYGDYNSFENSYFKIDNNGVPGTHLDNLRFYNSFKVKGINFNNSESIVYSNQHSNGVDFKTLPVTPKSKGILEFEKTYDYNSKTLETKRQVYDPNETYLSNMTTEFTFNSSSEIEEVELNDGTKINTEIKYTDGSEFSTDYPDIEFYGVAKIVKTTKYNNGEISNLNVYDLFGNLVLSFKDIANPVSNWAPSLSEFEKLTKFYFDLNRKLNKVSEFVGNGNFRDSYYWYDEYGRGIHSYNPDFGYTHFSYDDTGNLRFSQNQKQFEEDRISYFEYDDLGRLIVRGDAKIDPILFGNGFIPSIDESNGIENAVFNTMLDVKDINGEHVINPNVLNDGGVSIDNNSNRILTSNKTMWIDDNNYDCYLYDGIINDTIYNINSVPLLADKVNNILGTSYDLPPLGIVHKNYLFNDVDYPNSNNNGAAPYAFEHLNWYDNFIRRVNFYDELPPRIGKLWKYMPKTEFIDYLSYDDGITNDAPQTLYNLKGRVAVQAYREYENQPFNFIYYSYDGRGRIESLIRFTENLGFDCIYYQYNSMNRITDMVVMGPRNSVKTSYEYDDFGRLEKVYSDLGNGHGLSSYQGVSYLNDLPPGGSLNISFLDLTNLNPDIVYSYDSDNKVSSVVYSPNGVNMKVNNFYEPGLRLLEQITATDNLNIPLYTELLGYDLLKRINTSLKVHYENGVQVHSENLTYQYDDLDQLVSWTDNSTPMQNFNYDPLGNRTSSLNHQDAPNALVNYSYDINYPVSSRLMEASQIDNWKNTYSYYPTGQVKERNKSKQIVAQTGSSDAIWKHKKEKFEYNSFGLLREYKSDFYYGSDDCDLPYDQAEEVVWTYGYNPFNERESKRMTKAPGADVDDNAYAMMYYQLDEKNKQHINYVGIQSSNSNFAVVINNNTSQIGVEPSRFPNYYWPTCLWHYPPDPPPSKSEEWMIYPAQMNVYGLSNTANINYKFERSTASWKKHYNVLDYKGDVKQSYVEDGANILATNMNSKKPYGNTEWTNSNITSSKNDLETWVGKEKDYESNLGDHGVRKYEYETGRFLSIDPLWAKYYGWTPYQYSGNDPINRSDINGNAWVTDHIRMDQAGRRLYGQSLFTVGLTSMFDGIEQLYIEVFEGVGVFYQEESHLDNMSNDEIRPLLENGDYKNWTTHQTQDFYFHSNYIELMLDSKRGYTESTIPAFNQLKKGSRLYNYILDNIRTTNYPELNETDKYSHDPIKNVNDKFKYFEEEGAFSAKDDSKHDLYNAAFRLGVIGTAYIYLYRQQLRQNATLKYLDDASGEEDSNNQEGGLAK